VAVRAVKGILALMIRRGGIALLIALAVASAPVVLEVCRITCQTLHVHPSVAHAATHQPSCHESGTAPPTLSVHAHPCDHDGEATTPGVAAARHSDASLLAAEVLASDTATLVRTSARPTDGPSRVPDRVEVHLAIPLRI